jgi:hypothetical protein
LNVYEINRYWIAADKKIEAYWHYLEEEGNLEYIFDDGKELAEGETDVAQIFIRRVPRSELEIKNIRCHIDSEYDCQICKDSDEHIYYSFQDLIDSKHTDDFPCVIAKDE